MIVDSVGRFMPKLLGFINGVTGTDVEPLAYGHISAEDEVPVMYSLKPLLHCLM